MFLLPTCHHRVIESLQSGSGPAQKRKGAMAMAPPEERPQRAQGVEGKGKSLPESKPQGRIPLGQVIFDEIFLWFLLSLVISFLVYNLWGMLDLLRSPVVGD